MLLDYEVVTFNFDKYQKQLIELYEETKKENTSNKYQCSLCGYIYDDAKEEIKFEDLPDDWKCPLCGAPKNMFYEI